MVSGSITQALLAILSLLPYKNRLVNFQAIIENAVFLLCLCLAVLLHLGGLSDEGRVSLCWSIIVVVFFLVLFELAFVILQLLSVFRKERRNAFIDPERESVGSKETELKELNRATTGMMTEDLVDISSKLRDESSRAVQVTNGETESTDINDQRKEGFSQVLEIRRGRREEERYLGAGGGVMMCVEELAIIK